jgi:hypothetical protein
MRPASVPGFAAYRRSAHTGLQMAVSRASGANVHLSILRSGARKTTIFDAV